MSTSEREFSVVMLLPWLGRQALGVVTGLGDFVLFSGETFRSAFRSRRLPLEQTTDLANKEIRQCSLEALRQLDLESHAAHYPSQLSGGMQKRLALARAIVTQPQLVFFDEPPPASTLSGATTSSPRSRSASPPSPTSRSSLVPPHADRPSTTDFGHLERLARGAMAHFSGAAEGFAQEDSERGELRLRTGSMNMPTFSTSKKPRSK